MILPTGSVVIAVEKTLPDWMKRQMSNIIMDFQEMWNLEEKEITYNQAAVDQSFCGFVCGLLSVVNPRSNFNSRFVNNQEVNNEVQDKA